MSQNSTSRFWMAVVSVLLMVGILVGLGIVAFAARNPDAPQKAATASGPAVITLTASWCGTCRELLPVIQRVAQAQSNMKFVMLDVDQGTSPNEARQYGVTVSGGDLPEVYAFRNGKTTLIFTGRNYRFGQTAKAESQLKQALNEHP